MGVLKWGFCMGNLNGDYNWGFCRRFCKGIDLGWGFCLGDFVRGFCMGGLIGDCIHVSFFKSLTKSFQIPF